MSIASVTVAYNSASVLPRHLQALEQQSRRLDEIIVVDNASTDATRRILVENFPHVTVIEMSQNTGAGGGFAEGLRYAVERRGHDWVWLFDHDSLPHPAGLKQLLSVLPGLEGRGLRAGILAPLPVHEGVGLDYPGLLWRHGWRRPGPQADREAISLVDAVISSGSLVSREAILDAGLPRADFFIDFVDFEHCLRLRRHGFAIAVVRKTRLAHTIGSPRIVRIVGHSRPWADHAPWREYYIARNQTFTVWSEYPDWRSKASVLRRLARHALGIAAFGREKSRCLTMMWRGFLDGRAGRLGIRVGESAR